jgi:hypothetical protein
VVDNLLDFFDSVLINDFLFDNFHGLNSRYFDLNLDNLLNSLRHLNNLLDDLDYRNWLLDSDFNDFWDRFNMVDDFSGISVLN